jgi:nucleotide-binding universal stress UspA family protein
MTILVAVADDDLRDRVLAMGVELGTAFEEPLYVVHLTEDEVADGDTRTIRHEIEETLADSGVEYTVAVEHAGFTTGRSGRSTGKQLAEIAADVDISHVVVGHESKRALRSLAQGNTAFAVADATNIPVTIVPTTHED